MELGFAGRTVAVTGAAGPLGVALVGRLVERGAQVVAIVAPWRTELSAGWGDTVLVRRADLRDEAAVAAAYAGIDELWASLHAVGAFTAEPIDRVSAASARRMLETNALAALLCCREAVRCMRSTGRGGRIVNVAARPALVPSPGMAAYAMGKAAVAALTATLAVELRAERILVNAVVPSTIDGPANRAAMPDADHDAWPSPAQVAGAMLFLASPANEVTSGALVPVYGRA